MNMIKKAVVLAVMASSALVAQSAFATVVSDGDHNPQKIIPFGDGLGGFSSSYGDSFNAAASGSTFDDAFGFTVTATSEADSSLTTSIPTTAKGLDISLFQVVKYDTTTGSILSTYKSTGNDLSAILSTGSYYIEVAGTVTGAKGGSFGGNLDVTVTAVPEPETYAMLFAGLGLMGFMVRRNKKQA
jgi:hypothetical protein